MRQKKSQFTDKLRKCYIKTECSSGKVHSYNDDVVQAIMFIYLIYG